MGRGSYLGGSTQIGIYNKEEALIKKIYSSLRRELRLAKIPYYMVKEYFKHNPFALNELEEIYEDLESNFNKKRKEWEITFLNFCKSQNYQIDTEYEEEKKEIKKYTPLKNDLIDSLKFDLECLEKKIKKNPTNNYLKEQRKDILKKIQSITEGYYNKK